MFLFFLVLFTAVCLSAFVVIHLMDITMFNEDRVKAKLEEEQLYDKLIDSMGEPKQDAGLGAKTFVEIIGIDATKLFIDEAVSSVISYLKNPAIQKIEIGLPEGIFSAETTISLGHVITKEQLSFLRQAKVVVQTLLVTRVAALLLSVASIVIIIIIAKGIGSKIRWVGYSFLPTGILIVVLSLLFQGFLISTLNSWYSAGVVISFIQSLVWDYISLVQFCGLALFFVGVLIVWFSILCFSPYFKDARERILKEKKELAKKREEAEAREKGYR